MFFCLILSFLTWCSSHPLVVTKSHSLFWVFHLRLLNLQLDMDGFGPFLELFASSHPFELPDGLQNGKLSLHLSSASDLHQSSGSASVFDPFPQGLNLMGELCSQGLPLVYHELSSNKHRIDGAHLSNPVESRVLKVRTTDQTEHYNSLHLRTHSRCMQLKTFRVSFRFLWVFLMHVQV